MVVGSVDYSSSYFKYKIATPIQGEPTNKTLKKLKLELQANASSVETDLGGGDHGYLGLILTDSEYASIPGTSPFVAPNYPGPLSIPNNATPIEALNTKDQHAEAKRLYLECKNVEKALMRHTQDAIEGKYIDSLVDEYTNLITGDIPVVLSYLFYNYGKVRSDEVAEKEAEVMSLTWQPSDPMVILTRPLEQLKKLAVQAHMPYTDCQILQKGLQLIRNTNDFEYALQMWEGKSDEEKTWTNFKTHFHEHQLNLRNIRGPTMQQAGYHHANALAKQVTKNINNQLQERDNNMLAMLQTLPPIAESRANETSDSTLTYTANSVTTTDTQLAILQLLRDIQMDLKQSKSNPKDQRQNRSSQYKNSRQKGPGRKTPDDRTEPPRADKSKYCWTHGACNHNGKYCTCPELGQKVKATFSNKLGGSCAYCN